MEKGPSVALKLICLASNIIKEVCGVLNSFLSFLKKFDERKHIIYMLALMLDPRLKSLHLVFSFIGCDQGIAIVEQYDTMPLYLILMKCYYHLHPSIEFDNSFANHKVDDDNNMNIFQMIVASKKTC
jgi:hypothetical protein